MSLIYKLYNEEQGVTSIEYALIGSLIAVVIVIAVSATGRAVLALFQSVVDSFP